MKSGGINIISTYVFWNIHEEQEGVFKWDKHRDLRKFIDLCAKHKIFALVRIGPFGHGEIRNGGLPDWLLSKPLMVRTNDSLYLRFVDKFFNEISKQVNGYLFKDNGPIIGFQIENEYQHSASPWGLTYPNQPHDFTVSERDVSLTQAGVGISNESNPFAKTGNDHMKVLKLIAQKAGLLAPLYTVTGWGNAAIIENESIPVGAAYAYPFWTPKRDYSPFYLYKDLHKNPDYSPVRYNPENYPAFPAELGSGIMDVYTRRPVAVHKSMDALINRCLGSGANGIGYYMYHGGSSPKGEKNYFADEAYGLPKISYDFQAPIGEFGQVREGFHRLKLIHWFLEDFGEYLAPMKTVLPENAQKLHPENLSDLRFATRIKENSGFLFVNNFQDDTTLIEKKNIRVTIKTKDELIEFPSFDLKVDESLIFPYNLNVSGIKIQYATAQPLCKINGNLVFFKQDSSSAVISILNQKGLRINNCKGVYFKKDSQKMLFTVKKDIGEIRLLLNGKELNILIVDKNIALKASKFEYGNALSLLFSDGYTVNSTLPEIILDKAGTELSIYPKTSRKVCVNLGEITNHSSNPIFDTYNIRIPEVSFKTEILKIGEQKYSLLLPESLKNANDLFLSVNYTGDTGMGFIKDDLRIDHFYNGIPWHIGLKKFYVEDNPKEIIFYFRPMYRNASYLVDLPGKSIPEFGNQQNYLKVDSFTFRAEYKIKLGFNL